MELVKKYNELIKLSIQIKSIFNKGNYTEKQKQIKICENDIEFYKTMKRKIQNNS